MWIAHSDWKATPHLSHIGCQFPIITKKLMDICVLVKNHTSYVCCLRGCNMVIDLFNTFVVHDIEYRYKFIYSRSVSIFFSNLECIHCIKFHNHNHHRLPAMINWENFRWPKFRRWRIQHYSSLALSSAPPTAIKLVVLWSTDGS